MDNLNEIATAAENLKEYIRQYGTNSDLRIVKAQIEKMQFNLEVLQGQRTKTGSLVGA